MKRKGARSAPKRGEVWIVNFDPTVGSEVRKTRPAIILQNDAGNRFSSVTIVAAISSQFDDVLYPTEVMIEPPEGGVKEPSVALLNQIRTVDVQRLHQRVGVLSSATMRKIDQAVQISLGLI